MNSIKLYNRMDIIFMNSGNSKTFDRHRLLLSLIDKINLKIMINLLLQQTLTFTIHGKIKKNHIKLLKFKISAPTWNKEFELTHRSFSVLDIQDSEKCLIILR